ncbi:inhibitor of prohead protease [Aeromonas phage ZPAH1]|nr:inhibitor of prohead protease [Aeromonas phage Aswh_1]QQG34022.1 inhibitor of prohead protease [Aeromonas phage ZPAH1]
MAKKEELKEFDLGVINEIVESNTAPEAKAKIQTYAKECGFKISKSNISVDDMIQKLLEMADEKENEKLNASPMDKVPTPKVDVEYKPSETKVEVPVEPMEPIGYNPPEVEFEKLTEAIQKEELYIKEKLSMDGVGIPTADELIKTSGELYTPSVPEDGKSVEVAKTAASEPEKVDLDWMTGFTPKTSLIGVTGKQYMNCPYWILDWILETGPTWKSKISENPRVSDHAMLKTVLYYIVINGSVTVRESRNSQYHTLY